MMKLNVPVSVLDLGPVRKGKTMKEAIFDMVYLARRVETLGYKRFWIAEYHNAAALVSSAPVVLMKHVLDRTTTIRVGSGGILLPNYSPLIVAEQFGTLAHLHPNRIDLGIGRMTGSDPETMKAILGEKHEERVKSFPEDMKALLRYFSDEEMQEEVQASIAIGTHVPVYLLGSSMFSAELAGKLGLPYVFAAHIAPAHLDDALARYREAFTPSIYCKKPYVIVALNVIMADSDREAEYELTTAQQFILNAIRGVYNPLMPPVDSMDGRWTLAEKQVVNGTLRYSFVGSKETVKKQWIRFQKRYAIDELLAVTYIYDEEAQIHSYQLLKEMVDECSGE